VYGSIGQEIELTFAINPEVIRESGLFPAGMTIPSSRGPIEMSYGPKIHLTFSSFPPCSVRTDLKTGFSYPPFV
jgi:hypothetical protein